MVQRRTFLVGGAAVLGFFGIRANSQSNSGSGDSESDDEIELSVSDGYESPTYENSEDIPDEGGSVDGGDGGDMIGGDSDGEYRPPGGFENCEDENVDPEEDDPMTPNCDTNPYGD